MFESGVTGRSGAGLGLAIVRTIVVGHGREIEVAESRDGGVRFEVTTGSGTTVEPEEEEEEAPAVGE